MENTNCYIGKFEMPYTVASNFKEKEILTIANIISGSRLGDKLCFSGFAHMFFDEENDNKHWNPHIQLLEGFTRNKTNIMVLSIKEGYKYDKIFVYQTTFKDSGFYGILCFNTETQKSLHIFNVEYDWSKFIIVLSRIIKNNKI